jgi:preprotein translocase subunit SecD
LEIIDPMGRFLAPGTMVATTLGSPSAADAFSTPSARDDTVYETIVSGADFRDVFVAASASGDPTIGFVLDDAAAQRLHVYTSSHRGQTLSVVLDKQVISSPRINGAIAARGLIEGFPPDDLDDLVIALRAGVFPVPLALIEQRVVPATRVPGTPAASRATSAEE